MVCLWCWAADLKTAEGLIAITLMHYLWSEETTGRSQKSLSFKLSQYREMQYFSKEILHLYLNSINQTNKCVSVFIRVFLYTNLNFKHWKLFLGGGLALFFLLLWLTFLCLWSAGLLQLPWGWTIILVLATSSSKTLLNFFFKLIDLFYCYCSAKSIITGFKARCLLYALPSRASVSQSIKCPRMKVLISLWF